MRASTRIIPLLTLLILLTLIACRAAEPGAEPTTSAPTSEPIEVPTEAPTAAPTEPATAAPTDEPPADPTLEPTAQAGDPDGFCPRLPRPALVVQSRGELAITNPFSDEQCPLDTGSPFYGNMQAAGNALFYLHVEDTGTLIRQITPDGQVRDLQMTLVNNNEQSLSAFAVSPDGQTIAWSTATFEDQPHQSSAIHIAPTGLDGSATEVSVQTILESPSRDDGRVLLPLRFDDSGQILAYTLQPIGIGGAWSSFVGRYDSVYTIPANGGETLHAFDCPELGLFLCIGEFQLDPSGLQAVAYVHENVVEIVDGENNPLASITVDSEYVAYPTFSPAGELVFYSAVIGEGQGGFPFALPGAYHRVAPPYTGEPTLIASQDGLLTPYRWFDDTHLIVGLGDEAGSWGAALLDFDGAITRLAPWPDTAAVTVIP